MNTNHTFAGSGQPPSQIQRGLDDYDRDTIAHLASAGVSDALLQRVLIFDGINARAKSSSAEVSR